MKYLTINFSPHNLQYCKLCGEKLNNYHNDQYYYSEFYSNIYRPTVTSEEDYIKMYIGSTYDIVKKEKFSLIAFILGPFYLLFKKVYTPAFLFLLLTIGLYMYNSDVSYIFYIIISGYIGIKGTSMYLQHATRKVEEIKIGNPDKSSTEILEICKKAGQIKQSVLIIIIFITLTPLFFIINHTFEITNNSNDIQEQPKEIIETTAYNTKNLNYELNNDFITTVFMNNYRKYEFKDDTNYCHITIFVDKYKPIYNSIEEYIQKNIYIEENYISNNTVNRNINGNNFLIKEIDTNNTKRLLLFTTNNDDIYSIDYKANNNYTNLYCKSTIETFIKTVNITQEKEQ